MHPRHSVSAPMSPLLLGATEGTSRPQSTTPPTSASPSRCRWSDVVPPNSALTFAVVWDPDDEMVAFSSAELLGENQGDDVAALSPTDACSQVLTIGQSTVPLSENTATLQYFRENYEWLFEDSCTRDRLKLGRTQTSSTLGELDVYLRGSLMGKVHRHNKSFSCLRMLDSEFKFDPRMSFAKKLPEALGDERESIIDEGFYEVECLPIRAPNNNQFFSVSLNFIGQGSGLSEVFRIRVDRVVQSLPLTIVTLPRRGLK
ncbi:hypothetical protein VNI00_010452 [Paramarasmius palmivorus]|uniref:Uncharacterized protein n=1 Tax=Paramarasmius palmivorus TaxID=297713 RepID=A0AAW0CJ88_9AGAR